jgi:thiamine kinase-like enzyme
MTDLDTIVGRLEGRLGVADGAPTPLEGGITNRNFRLRLGGREYVVRVPGKRTELLGISREAERIAAATAARIGIGPPVAAVEDSFLVTSYLGGTPMSPTAVAARAEELARALRAFHGSGARLPVRFWVPSLLERYAQIVRSRGARLPEAYSFAQGVARRIAESLPLSDPVPCHNDLLPGNLLSHDGRIALVDWEYAGMGHRMFDLGNLAVNGELDDAAEGRLLRAYFEEDPGPERRAAVKLMRLMSDAREAAWGVVQGVVSELEFDFGSYAERHFERLRAAAGADALEEWLYDAAA